MIEIIELLLQCGSDPNGIDSGGRPVLHRAIMFGASLEVVKLLLIWSQSFICGLGGGNCIALYHKYTKREG